MAKKINLKQIIFSFSIIKTLKFLKLPLLTYLVPRCNFEKIWRKNVINSNCIQYQDFTVFLSSLKIKLNKEIYTFGNVFASYTNKKISNVQFTIHVEGKGR